MIVPSIYATILPSINPKFHIFIQTPIHPFNLNSPIISLLIHKFHPLDNFTNRLFIHPPICLYVQASVHSTIEASIQPSIYPFIHSAIQPSIQPSIYPSVYPSNHPWRFCLYFQLNFWNILFLFFSPSNIVLSIGSLNLHSPISFFLKFVRVLHH